MIKNQNHIIASCHWDTIFNDKNKGAELQNTLGHWSAHYMPREISTVFNAICPENKTLKIKTLEVDLGPVNYENCIEEISLKLKEELYYKLNDIVMHPQKNGQSIEIIAEKKSHISILKYFLLHGVMPWNHYGIKASINQILEKEIICNKDEVIRMIQLVGDQQYVRKRIAWQFKEASLKRIIENIEKSDHSYIIEFSEEFVKIQEQQAIVKIGISDFKKNLWFWILNYLFVERGTLFNKVEFVSSTIQQMANHYSIEYDKLYAMIEDAVHKIQLHSSAKTNFIIILSILSKRQSDITHNKFSSKRQLEKHWCLLQHYIKSPSNCSTTHQKIQFNELIKALSQLDSSRFNKIIDSLDSHSFIWRFMATHLKPMAFNTLLGVLSPTKEKTMELVNQIHFFSQLKGANLFKLEKNWIRQIGLQFLKQDKSTSLLNGGFLNYFAEQLSLSNKMSKTMVLESLVSLELPVAQKNIINLAIYQELKQTYIWEDSNQEPLFSKSRLIAILEALKANKQSILNQAKFENHFKLICTWIKVQPIIVWEILLSYQETFLVRNLIDYVIEDKNIALQLLENNYPKYYNIITDLQQRINKLGYEEKSLSTSVLAIKECLALVSIQLLLIYKELSSYSFLELLLITLNEKQGIGNASGFKKSISKIFKNYNFDKLDISESQQKQLLEFTSKVFYRSDLEVLLAYMGSLDNHKKVGALLRKLVHTKQINTSEFKFFAKQISDYFIKNIDLMQLEFIKRYTPEFKKIKYTSTAIEQKIFESYWQCIVDYDYYKSDKIKFSALLEKAIAYNFIGNTVIEDHRKVNLLKENKATVNTPDYTIKIATSELAEKLKQGLMHPEIKIILDGNTIEIKKLILYVLENQPYQMRLFFKETVLSSKQFSVLRTLISLEQFVALIARDQPNSLLSRLYESIYVLYTVVKELDAAQIVKKIESKLFEFSLDLLKLRTIKKEELTKIVVYVFKKLAEFSFIKSEYLLKQIQQKNIEVPELLKAVLLIQNPKLELLTSIKIEEEISEDLQACITKNKFEDLCVSLFKEDRIPFWFSHKKSSSVRHLVNQMLKHHPLNVLSVLRGKKVTKKQQIRLSGHIDLSNFTTVLGKLYPSNKNQLQQLEKLYGALENSDLRGGSALVMQLVIINNILGSWVSSNWKLISSANIWMELLWETSTNKNSDETYFFDAFDTLKPQLPLALQISYLDLFKDRNLRASNNLKIKKEDKPLPIREIRDTQNIEIQSIGVAVPNAGLVLLNTYFTMLFERLGVLENKKFVSEEKQIKAVHYLQYVVTGFSRTEETLLPLNKILCGIALQNPIRDSIKILDKEKTLIEGLLTSAMSYWEAIGSSSIQGFRGNWLVRNGVLREEEERWNLIVEKKAYDVLLIKSPFSFSIIKYPWMTKPLHVSWSY